MSSNTQPNNTYTTLTTEYNKAISELNKIDNINNINNKNKLNDVNNIVIKYCNEIIKLNSKCNEKINKTYTNYISLIEKISNQIINQTNIQILNITLLFYKKEAFRTIHEIYYIFLNCNIKSKINEIRQQAKITTSPTTSQTISPTTSPITNNKILNNLYSERLKCSNNQSRYVLIEMLKILKELLPEYKLNKFKELLSKSLSTNNNNILNGFNNIILKIIRQNNKTK